MQGIKKPYSTSNNTDKDNDKVNSLHQMVQKSRQKSNNTQLTNTKVIKEEDFNSEQSINYFIPESEKINKYKMLQSRKKVEDTVSVLEQLEMEF